MCHFKLEKSFKNHRVDCENINKCRAILPNEKDKILNFKNYRYKEKIPISIYADIDCLLEKNTDVKSSAYQKHVPTSVAFYKHCNCDDSLSELQLYRGEDCISWFMNELKRLSEEVDSLIKNIIPMERLTLQQEQEFKTAKNCHICKKPFTNDDIKHRDHDHFTGKLRGASHQSCNINYKDSHVIPVVFHNLSGYDAHFFIKVLSTSYKGDFQLLPINKEKYISFTKQVENTNVKLRFIDSFRFMPSSLEKLASYLSNDEKKITRKHCKNQDEFNLLTRKGVFPYDYIDSWEKLQEFQLPSKENFYSKLNNSNISEQDHQHAYKVWETFKLNTLGEYSDLYLKTDGLLLADTFENFRKTCFKTYNLDPLHYSTAPGLAFDAMLKYTEIELDLFTDVEMLLFI